MAHLVTNMAFVHSYNAKVDSAAWYMSNRVIKIAICSAHPMTLAGISRWVEQTKPYSLVGEAISRDQILQIFSVVEPDILILDLDLEANSLDLIRLVQTRSVRTRILASGGTDHVTANQAIAAGAKAYLSRDEGMQITLEALRWISEDNGASWISPVVAAAAMRLDSLIRSLKLTPTEIAVLSHSNKSNSEIARELYVSEGTVRNHISTIYHKVGVDSRQALVRWGELNGFVMTVHKRPIAVSKA